jgi:hypothetical protein
VFLFFVAFAFFIFTGCWDRVEIENRAFVVAIGIDKGEEKNYAVTLSVPVYEKDENENEKNAELKTAEGENISDALKIIADKNEKQIYYGQTNLIIFGEEIFHNEELFQSAVEELNLVLKSPRRIAVAISKNAAKILREKPPDEIIPHNQNLPTLNEFVNKFPLLYNHNDKGSFLCFV